MTEAKFFNLYYFDLSQQFTTGYINSYKSRESSRMSLLYTQTVI